MSYFPVIESEIAETEALLGIELPPVYKSLLLDPATREILEHPALGSFSPTVTMTEFAKRTFELRELHPEFPRDGVLLECSVDGDDKLKLGSYDYVRFWLPDKRTPSQLGAMVYSWSVEKRKIYRNCSTTSWIQVDIEIVYKEDPGLFQRLGYPIPDIKEPEPLLKVRPQTPFLSELFAKSGKSATTAVREHEGAWIDCGLMNVKGKYLSPCDIFQSPDAGRARSVKVVPGIYETRVKIKLSRLGSWPIVTALQVVRKDAKPEERKELFQLDIDLGACAVFDRQPFFKQVLVDDRESVAMDLTELENTPCIAVAGRSAELFVAPTGDGDGSYPVYSLWHSETCEGLEIDFNT